MHYLRNPKVFTIFIIFCTGIGGILYGYDIGVISGALLFIQKTIPMTRLEVGVIVGAVLTGGLFGSLFLGGLSDRFGRRAMIMVACLIFGVGIITMLFAETFLTILISRLLLGIGVGVISVAVPLYLAEIAPTNLRGRSVTAFQLFLTFGILLAYFVDLLLTPGAHWRMMFAVILLPATLLFILMLFLPESPRWLMAQGRHAAAKTVLSRTRSQEEVVAELDAIQSSLLTEKSSWLTLFRMKSCWLPLFVALSIAALNQLTGINVLLQYAPLVIKQAGLHSKMGLMLGTVGLGTINFVGTVLSLFLVDYLGRRKLLLIGTVGIMVSYIYLALLSHLMVVGRAEALFALVGLLGYVVFYAVGPGVVVWLAISELLPTEVRGKGMALSLFTNALSASILSTLFLLIEHDFGMSGTYLLLTAFTFLYFLVAYYLLPETKNRSLEEIRAYYQDLVI